MELDALKITIIHCKFFNLVITGTLSLHAYNFGNYIYQDTVVSKTVYGMCVIITCITSVILYSKCVYLLAYMLCVYIFMYTYCEF